MHDKSRPSFTSAGNHAFSASGVNNVGARCLAWQRHSGGSSLVTHIHNFRGLAIIFIVATHCLRLFDWSASPETIRVLKYVVANGTIFFLFISGYLFEYLRHQFRLRRYWSNKVRYVVLPYLTVSLPALFVFTQVMPRWGVRDGFYEQSISLQLLEFLVTGTHVAPFWFIPTIVAFYLVAPLLELASRRDAFFWLLPLLFVIPALVPRSANPALNMVHFLPIWTLGMACCRFSSTWNPMLVRASTLLLVLTIGLSVVELIFAPGTHTYLGYLQKTAMTLLLLVALLTLQHRADRWLAWAGTLSFGMFFVHSYLITGTRLAITAAFGQLPAGSIPAYLLGSALAVIASAAMVAFVRRLLGARSRLVIGV